MKGALRPRVHIFLASSPIHMQYKLKMTEEQVVNNAVAATKALRELGCEDIEFSPEDATRCALRGDNCDWKTFTPLHVAHDPTVEP